LYVLVSGYVC